jgi:FMN-dependent NADH-azoreductase
MITLLRIDASSRQTGSNSRALGDSFERVWTARHPGAKIVRRDLARDPLPHIADDTIAGYYAPPEKMTDALRNATALSDKLIAELKAADAVLVTVPMYNFSIPSAFKAWIDQIVRVGHTFSYDGQAFTGLVTGKPVFIACAYGAGGYNDKGPLSTFNMLRPYLELLFGFLGFTEVTFVGVEHTTADPASVTTNLDRACVEISRIAEAA